MAVILTNQWFDYPMYLAEVTLSTGDVVAFWLSSFAGFTSNAPGAEPVYTGGAPTAVSGGDGDVGLAFYGGSGFASLLAAVKSWAEGFDWGTLVSGASYSSITITKYGEASSDATPA